jgi:hypothetical protein
MTEHLPECWASEPSDPAAWCICDELRACQTRVLDAARDALAALRGCIGTYGSGDGAVWIEKFDALSAIYALRKDQR